MRRSTCIYFVKYCREVWIAPAVIDWGDLLTLARYLDPGRPPSRANAHNMREAVAMRPTVAKN